MEIKIDHYDIKQWIQAIADKLETQLQEDCQEYKAKLPRQHGKGQIKGYEFKDGIQVFLIDATFKEDFKIHITPDQIHPIHFHFCTQGDFRHSLGSNGMSNYSSYQLNPLSGSITSNPNSCEQTMLFPGGCKVLHTNLQISRRKYNERAECNLEKMPERLRKVFKDLNSEELFLYESNYNIPTADCIQKLAHNEYKGLVRSSFCEAKALELLSLQLKQFADDIDPEARFTTLKEYDLEKIKQAKRILINDLSDAPTIPELARQVGINQQKLKKGFKEIYGKTIFQYLTDARMEAARYMLMEGVHSIKSVANRHGYSNQSHFARRFKERYGISPKHAIKISKMQKTTN